MNVADACMVPVGGTVQQLVAVVARAKFGVSTAGAYALGTLRDATGTIDFMFDRPPQGIAAATIENQAISIELAHVQDYKGKKRLKFDAAAFALAAGSPLPAAAPAPLPTPHPQQQQAPAGFQQLPAPSLPRPQFQAPQPPPGQPTLASCLALIEQAAPIVGQALSVIAGSAAPEARVEAGGALLSTLLIAYTSEKSTLHFAPLLMKDIDDDIPF